MRIERTKGERFAAPPAGRVLLAGVTGAVTIDAYLGLTQAGLFREATVRDIFLWDASNVLGDACFQRRLGDDALRTSLQVLVSLIRGAVFAALYASIATVRKRTLAAGALFGIVVMINLPAAHVFFGMPVAWVMRRAGHTGAT